MARRSAPGFAPVKQLEFHADALAELEQQALFSQLVRVDAANSG
jgi:hypothetical protein